jgi:hypothetical protein
MYWTESESRTLAIVPILYKRKLWEVGATAWAVLAGGTQIGRS